MVHPTLNLGILSNFIWFVFLFCLLGFSWIYYVSRFENFIPIISDAMTFYWSCTDRLWDAMTYLGIIVFYFDVLGCILESVIFKLFSFLYFFNDSNDGRFQCKLKHDVLLVGSSFTFGAKYWQQYIWVGWNILKKMSGEIDYQCKLVTTISIWSHLWADILWPKLTICGQFFRSRGEYILHIWAVTWNA